MMHYGGAVPAGPPATEQEMELNADRLAVMRRLEMSPSYRCPDMMPMQQCLVRQEGDCVEHEEEAIQNQSQNPPLHLQRAALEECAQFLEQLAVENPNNHKKKKTKKTKVSTWKHHFQAVSICISSPAPSRPDMGRKKSSSKRLGGSPSGVMDADFDQVSTSRHRRLEKAALPFQNAEAVLKCMATWRSRMAVWAYQAVDAYGFDRSHVATAFNSLDRYVAKLLQRQTADSPMISREDYQLMSMTALYMAIKVGEPVRKLCPEALVDMSRGAFTASQFESMEADMLQTLEWRVNPPTASAYVDLLLEYLPLLVRPAVRSAARQLVELAVTDARLAKTPPSVLAVSAILLALLELSMPSHHYNHYHCDTAVMADEFVQRMEVVLDMSILGPQDEDDEEDEEDFATTIQQLKSLVRSPAQDLSYVPHPATT